MRWGCWIGLLCASCDVDDLDSGTAVGNPGDMDVAVVDVPPDIALDAVWVDVGGVALERCEGGAVVVPGPTILDGLVPSFAPVDLPAGSYCGVVVTLAGPVVVEGVTALNNAFTVDLALGELSFADAFTVDGDALVLGVPVPLDAPTLDDLGDGAVVEADAADAVAWAERSVADAVLVIDADADGRVSPSDPVIGGTVTPGFGDPLPAAVQTEEGCGCAGVPAVVGWLPVLLGLVASRRRRAART